MGGGRVGRAGRAGGGQHFMPLSGIMWHAEPTVGAGSRPLLLPCPAGICVRMAAAGGMGGVWGSGCVFGYLSHYCFRCFACSEYIWHAFCREI